MKIREAFGSWYELIKNILQLKESINLFNNLFREYQNKNVLPEKKDVFKIFQISNPEKVKLVILNSSPYTSLEHNNGLAFSTYYKNSPKVLNVIHQTLDEQIKFGRYLDINLGDRSLKYLIEQNVMLLNTRLSILWNQPNSHKYLGWNIFISRILMTLASSRRGEDLAFLAIGNEARDIIKPIYNKYKNKFYFISCEHPNVSINEKRKWDNKDCFNKINNYYEEKNLNKIIW
jgi:uracil-DNA glycosylase